MDAAPKKYNTVYKITNNASKKKKIYIGVHATDDLNDSYPGSGTALKCAREKHGDENFTKEILSTHDTYEEALAEEARIVDKEFVKRRDNYNITVGGRGGAYGLVSEETRAKQSDSHLGQIPWNKGIPATEAAKKNQSKGHIGNKASPETKARMTAAQMGHTHTPTILTDGEASAIYHSPKSNTVLAKEYGVHRPLIASIKAGRVRSNTTGARQKVPKKNFTDDEARAIYHSPKRDYILAKEYGVHGTTIANIKRGITYRNATGHGLIV